ncbi:hypothetical protein [uncultured Methanobrevibacter sp.]|uniref:hypothetical protein n=1 Tax=uncultured Methanobrevibacter sp. TaxID=253161 RepID=UPI0025EA58E0|nr:hypothetical protein [uncultured Methanobrevibacter sp.]
MFLTLTLVVCVCLSPLMAADNTYSVDINGVTFNIPNNYHEDEEMTMAEDGSVIDNYMEDHPCYYIGKVYTDGNNSISISTSSSYGDPFVAEDILDFSSGEKTIAGNRGEFYEYSPSELQMSNDNFYYKHDSLVSFRYVENGVCVMIEAEDVKTIEKVIGT